MKRIFTFLLMSNAGLSALAQWTTTAAPLLTWRYDDVYFTNPNMGWAIRYSLGSDGNVLKTIDSGVSWQNMPGSSPGAKYRDIGFLDSLNGFIGTIENGYNPGDTIIIYQTTDGGTTWSGVPNLPGPRPAGICGMFVVDDSSLYACGRYFGPAGFYKTTDKGVTWTYKNLAGLAGGAVDIHFFNKDTGIVVGSSGSYFSGKGRILRTVDGGSTWTIVHTSTHSQEICWKISFPSQNIGYVSLESFRASGPQYFLKTIDGGLTWTDMQFLSGGAYDAEGIGFINDTTGWIGGDPYNYKTIDGGVTWTSDNFGNHINRFRFFGDTLGYAAGEGIYKFQPTPAGTSNRNDGFTSYLYPQPNPFITKTEIHFQLNKACKIKLVIIDMNGNVIKDVEKQCFAGEQIITWDGTTLSGKVAASGLYHVTVQGPEGRLVGRIIKEK